MEVSQAGACSVFDIINITLVAQSPAVGLMHLSRVTARKNLVPNLDFITFTNSRDELFMLTFL